MPTYDYKCNNCGHFFEYFQSMTDNPLTKCPDCSQDGLKRLIGGGSGIIFKGSGFYVNDAKKSSSTSTPLKDKPAGEKSVPEKTSGEASVSSSDKKSEAKSAC